MIDGERPLVTIVTPSYNQARFIEETIESVLMQDYQPIEYIVIDGGSTDGTLDILKKYQDRLAWVSEPDRGQADGINKGFRRARGTILNWLNADDLLEPGAVSAAVSFFQTNPQAALVYGDALAIDEHGRSFGKRMHVRPCDFNILLNVGDFIVQPAAFWRSELWQTVGELDENWHYVLDYEYWIRAAQRYNFVYLPQPLAKERLYASAKTFSGGIKRIAELEAMSRRFGSEGVPLNYRSESAAVYLISALNQVKQRRFPAARADLHRALQLRRSSIRMLRYFLLMLVFGETGILGWRLMVNRLRNRFQRTL